MTSKTRTILAGLSAHWTPARPEAEGTEAKERRFLLQVVQPGLVGLMDGSVSTLAPVSANTIWFTRSFTGTHHGLSRR